MITMPSPRKTVTAGAGVCKRLGLDNKAALALVREVALAAGLRYHDETGMYADWISAVHREAHLRWLRTR